jgi:very-short-patch-repair endonuclease
LVIEIDGGIHRKQQRADLEREQVLKALGCSIIRFDNQTVEKELPEVILQIKEVIRNLSK